MDWYRLLLGAGAFFGLVGAAALGSWLLSRAPGAGGDPVTLRQDTLRERFPGEGCEHAPDHHQDS